MAIGAGARRRFGRPGERAGLASERRARCGGAEGEGGDDMEDSPARLPIVGNICTGRLRTDRRTDHHLRGRCRAVPGIVLQIATAYANGVGASQECSRRLVWMSKGGKFPGMGPPRAKGMKEKYAATRRPFDQEASRVRKGFRITVWAPVRASLRAWWHGRYQASTSSFDLKLRPQA